MQTKGSAHLTTNTLLPPAIQAWQSYLYDKGSSPYTVKAFTSDIRLLTKFFPPDKSIGAITTNDLNRFLEWMEKEREVPCSPKTLARRITSVKSFYRWLTQYGVLVLDPAEKVVQHSVISPLPQVLTEAEFDEVLAAADRHRRAQTRDARPFALIHLLLTTGIKKSELLGIHLNHVEVRAPGGPQVFIRYPSAANRYKERKLLLTEDWLPPYQEYLAQYQPTDRLFPWSPRNLEYILEDIGIEAGLAKHLSFDMCRWTCALRDFRSGLEPDKIRVKLGISKIQWREIGMKLRQLSESAR
ncbi:MAG TPA: site-specific integrase [Anaerolineales bacterium]|nr:site-specific integrase [Anaerolineales bacterium]